MYRLLFSLILRHLPAETVHHLAFAFLRGFMALPGMRSLVRAACRPRDPRLAVRALGLSFPSPVGLAAGFDKDARGPAALGALGFGFVEVGTITAEPQPGNPLPRLFRLPRDRALINRMGFNNAGAEAVAARLARPLPSSGAVVLGINIGKTKATPDERAVDDYVKSARLLGARADYFVVNVSSPNTPGLRDLQAVEKLEPLLRAVREALDGVAEGRHVPLLVKIAPDLADADVDAVADLAVALKLDGLIATNTTISRANLVTEPEVVAALGAGGLSGAPLKQRSLEVLRRLRARVGDALVLVSAGGIETVDDAWERLQAGATLLQIYTGFIYGGPGFVRGLNRGLAAKMAQRDAAMAPIVAASQSS